MATATRTRGSVTQRQPESAPAGSAPRTPASTALRTEFRTNRLGPFALTQLVLLELAAAVLLGAAAVHGLMLVPAAVVAGALVCFAVLRRHHRSVVDWFSTHLALRSRKQRMNGPLPSELLDDQGRLGVDAGFAPAAECVPGLHTQAYVDRDRRTVGMLGDGTFLTAVVRVEAVDSALRPAFGARALPLGLLHDALEIDGIRLESVQVVQHVQPAPAPHLPEQSVARRSYGPLQQQTGSPALRLTWVALKLDPELCPDAVQLRGGGLLGARRCLVRAADHLASRCTGAGFRTTVLSEEELVSAVATSACVNPVATARASQPDTPPARRATETAREWRCDDRHHTTYQVGRWPELGRAATPLPRLAALLTSVPTFTTTFSLTVGRSRGNKSAALAGHLRVTGRSETELDSARRHLERTARSAKVGLVRLDREQLPGVLATLPLGGAH